MTTLFYYYYIFMLTTANAMFFSVSTCLGLNTLSVASTLIALFFINHFDFITSVMVFFENNFLFFFNIWNFLVSSVGDLLTCPLDLIFEGRSPPFCTLQVLWVGFYLNSSLPLSSRAGTHRRFFRGFSTANDGGPAPSEEKETFWEYIKRIFRTINNFFFLIREWIRTLLPEKLQEREYELLIWQMLKCVFLLGLIRAVLDTIVGYAGFLQKFSKISPPQNFFTTDVSSSFVSGVMSDSISTGEVYRLYSVSDYASVLSVDDICWFTMMLFFTLYCYLILLFLFLVMLIAIAYYFSRGVDTLVETKLGGDFFFLLFLNRRVFEKCAFYLSFLIFFLMFLNEIFVSYYVLNGGTLCGGFKSDYLVYGVFFNRASIVLSGLVLLSMPKVYNILFDVSRSLPARLLYMLFYTTLVFSMYALLATLDLVLLFAVIELASFTTILLFAMDKRSVGSSSTQSSMILFFTSVGPSILFLFGCSVIYSVFGTCNLLDIGLSIKEAPELFFGKHYGAIVVALFCFICFFSFKLGCFPLNLWVADVYNGANWLLFWFLSTVYKLVIFLIFFKCLFFSFSDFLGEWFDVFITSIGLGSLFWGAYYSLGETNLRKFFAHASVFTSGLLILVFSCNNVVGSMTSAVFFFIYYSLSLTLLLAVFIRLGLLGPDVSVPAVIKNFESMVWLDSKRLLFFFLLALFSMLGLPPFPGFWFKLLVAKSLFFSGSQLMVWCFLVLQVVYTYAYFRIFGSVMRFTLSELLFKSNGVPISVVEEVARSKERTTFQSSNKKKEWCLDEFIFFWFLFFLVVVAPVIIFYFEVNLGLWTFFFIEGLITSSLCC